MREGGNEKQITYHLSAGIEGEWTIMNLGDYSTKLNEELMYGATDLLQAGTPEKYAVK